MRIIFESRDEYKSFVDTFCPASIGIEVEEDCDGECAKCLDNAGVTLIKEYEEKENESSN